MSFQKSWGLYGGYIYTTKSKHKNRRDTHHLRILSYYALPLLHILVDHSIIKRRQVELAIMFILTDDIAKCKIYSDAITKLKEECHLVTIPTTRLTKPYIAGLFDAEGSISSKGIGAIKCTIAQTCCPPLLRAIDNVWGLGAGFTRSEIVWCGRSAEIVLNGLVRYTIAKRSQALAAIELRKFTGIVLTVECYMIVSKMITICSFLSR
jgi:hypothetical protein